MIALDQNQIDRPPISNDLLVIPDAALYENIKGSDWENGFQQTFTPYKSDASRLHVAFPISKLLKMEIATGNPIKSVVDEEMSRQLRVVVSAPSLPKDFVAQVDKLRATGFAPEKNVADRRQTLSDGLDAFNKIVGPALLRALRQQAKTPTGKYTLPDLAPSILELTKKTLVDTLTEHGVANPASSPLMGTESMLFRHNLCYWSHIIQFARDSVTVSMGDKRLVNDVVDSDYALIGTFCDSLITNDGRMQERYEGMIAALKL